VTKNLKNVKKRFSYKKRLENKKETFKKRKKVTKTKNVKTFFYIHDVPYPVSSVYRLVFLPEVDEILKFMAHA